MKISKTEISILIENGITLFQDIQKLRAAFDCKIRNPNELLACQEKLGGVMIGSMVEKVQRFQKISTLKELLSHEMIESRIKFDSCGELLKTNSTC